MIIITGTNSDTSTRIKPLALANGQGRYIIQHRNYSTVYASGAWCYIIL